MMWLRVVFMLAVFCGSLLLTASPRFLASWAGTSQAQAAAMGGVPSAMWQDNDRAHRRSPSAVPDSSDLTKLGGPRANVEGRAAKVRSQVANGTMALPQGSYIGMLDANDWRLRIRDAAVTSGEMVTLGDIADPLGNVPPDMWLKLAATPLWPAPTEAGKAFQVNKARLSQALREVLKEVAERCILPTSIAVQRGGFVLREDDLRAFLVRSLTPQLNALPGKGELNDFRLPPYIFLAHPQQRVELEAGKVVPGRITFRYVVREIDGEVLKKVAGSAFLDLWVEVAAAARPLSKGEALRPESVTFIRMNVAQMREKPWDGRGGPWQVLRPIPTGQAIFQGDLATQSMVRKGNIVMLVYEKGNVRIETQAEVMTDAEPGETIAVRNIQTKKQIYAVVRDARTVVSKI